uniref:SKI/SNO/DAC domain-containing protein n=1 Tax=Setaria digitata TaxID=48799 RepID=A0A915PYN5_9BILA
MVEQFRRQRSVPENNAEFVNSIPESSEEQQNVKDLISQQQSAMITRLPTTPTCNDDKTSDSNSARIYTYRGRKIAGFELQGIQMICLPQAYEIFLKNVISGLHTVHSKLKRLQIRLVICNVEQVRALRSLGAIQQGVNRCKLISCDDFDQLYDDCYKIHHRSGRPAKRSAKWEDVRNDKTDKQQCCTNHMAPITTTQQIVLQHLMATAAAAAAISGSQQIQLTEKMISASVADQEFRSTSLPPTVPLNLTKNVDKNYQYENDNNISQEGFSSSNSECMLQTDCFNQNTSAEDRQILQTVLSKLVALIEIATLNLRAEREMVENKKSLLRKLEEDLELKNSEYEKMQREFFREQQKAQIYFRRYCKAKRESLKLREKLIDISHDAKINSKLQS